MSNLTLLIPAKFEFESLPIFLKELEKYDYKKKIILELNDTKTIEAAKQFTDVEILYQTKSGYGNALIEGINHTNTEYFSIINADGSMNPIELEKMLEEITNRDFDIVFGSRYMNNAGSEDDDLITSVGNFIFSFIGKVFFKLKISDILYTYVVGKTNHVKNLNLKLEVVDRKFRGTNFIYTLKTPSNTLIPVFVHSHHIHQHEVDEKFGIKRPIHIDHIVCF